MRSETIGDATLYCGDCREFGPGVVDHVITDPPYGNATHGGHLTLTTLKCGESARQELGFESVTSDDYVDMARYWCEIATGWIVFTGEWMHMHRLQDEGLLVRFGIWVKPNGAPQFTGDRPGMGWEAVAICHSKGRGRGGDKQKQWNGGGKHAVWTIPKEVGTNHPTQKPVRLYSQWVKDFTNRGELIYDPYMGSGTVGAAALGQGRRYIGVERDPKWFELACQRMNAVARQGRLFA